MDVLIRVLYNFLYYKYVNNNNNNNNSSQDYNRESRGGIKLQLLYANNGFRNGGERPSAIYTHIISVGFTRAERACSWSRTGFYFVLQFLLILVVNIKRVAISTTILTMFPTAATALWLSSRNPCKYQRLNW